MRGHEEFTRDALWKPPTNNPSNRDVAMLETAWAKACVPARRRFLQGLQETGALDEVIKRAKGRGK